MKVISVRVIFLVVFSHSVLPSLLSSSVLNQSRSKPLPAPLQPCQPSGVGGQTNSGVSRRPMWPMQAPVGAIRSGSPTENRSPSYSHYPPFLHLLRFTQRLHTAASHSPSSRRCSQQSATRQLNRDFLVHTCGQCIRANTGGLFDSAQGRINQRARAAETDRRICSAHSPRKLAPSR